MECTYLAFAVPILAVFLFAGIQKIDVIVEADILVNKNVESVYSFAKDPTNQKKIQKTITSLNVVDSESYLDEKDGNVKDQYTVTVEQDFPHYSGVLYNFSRTASSAEKVIQSEGQVLGITYKTTLTLVKKDSKTTAVTEVCEINLSLLWSAFVTSGIRQGHQQRLENLKQALEA